MRFSSLASLSLLTIVLLVSVRADVPAQAFLSADAARDLVSALLSALPGSGDVDVLYENGVRQTLFNGDAKGQHLTSAEYDARLAAADARYARLLTLLASAVYPDEKPRDE
jgi:hypothetical protein